MSKKSDKEKNAPEAEEEVTAASAEPEEAPPETGLDAWLGYRIPALVLTGMNLFLGLFSWVSINHILLGLGMFG